MADLAVPKMARVVVLLVCLVMTVIGAALAEPSGGSEYAVACSVFCVIFLLAACNFQYPVHIISMALVLYLSGSLALGASNDTDSKHRGGYALMIIGMWAGFLFVFENTLQKIAALPGQLFANTSNIIATCALVINFVGCCILWSKKSLSGDGTEGFVSGVLFVAAWFMLGPISMWCGLFFFTFYQYSALNEPINGCLSSPFEDSNYRDVCIAGYVFQWVGHIVFLTLMLFLAKGRAATAVVSEAGAQLKNALYLVQFIIIVVCLVGVIVGAIAAGGSNFSATGGSGWGSVNAVFCVVFLLAAVLQSDEKETAFYFVALALVILVSGDLVAAADRNNVSGGDTKIAGGNALMVLSLWLAFVGAAIPSLRSGLSGIQFSSPPVMLQLFTYIVMFISLVLMWTFVHQNTPTYSGYIPITIFVLLDWVLFIWACLVKRGGLTTLICAFYTTYLHVSVMTTALILRNQKEGSGPGEIPHLNTFLAGLFMAWICQLIFIAVSIYQYLSSPAAAIGTGASQGNVAQPHPPVTADATKDKPMTTVGASAGTPAADQQQPAPISAAPQPQPSASAAVAATEPGAKPSVDVAVAINPAAEGAPAAAPTHALNP